MEDPSFLTLTRINSQPQERPALLWHPVKDTGRAWHISSCEPGIVHLEPTLTRPALTSMDFLSSLQCPPLLPVPAFHFLKAEPSSLAGGSLFFYRLQVSLHFPAERQMPGEKGAVPLTHSKSLINICPINSHVK